MSNPTYIPGEEIARGGMGAVLRATDQKIGRTVAMKVMLRRASTEQVHRFLQEARVLGQLTHPNIVPVYDLGRDDNGTIFYTMKLVQGDTLNDILKRLRSGDKAALARYPLNTLLTIFQKVCDAVAFAHSRNIIHRDLKPHNVMVGEFGEVLVMDWGLAKVLTEGEEDLPTMADIFGDLEPDAPADSGSIARPRSSAAGVKEIADNIGSTEQDPDTTIGTDSGGTISDHTDANLSVTVRADGVTDDGHDYDFVINPTDVGPNLKFDTAHTESPRSDAYVTRDGAVMGTPSYMSTEQAAGRVGDLDGRSDIYSLGAILYCILALRPPVEEKSGSDSADTSRTGTILPPIDLTPTHTRRGTRTQGRPDEAEEIVSPADLYSLAHCPGGTVPSALSAVTMKALAHNREDRYQTIAELTHDIDAYQGGFATQAEDAGAGRLIQLFIRRNKVIALAILIGLIVTAGFMAKVIEGERRANAKAAEADENRILADNAATNAVLAAQATSNALVKVQIEKQRADTNSVRAEVNRQLAVRKANEAETNRLKAVSNLTKAITAEAAAKTNLAKALAQEALAKQSAEKEKEAAKEAKDANERAQIAKSNAEAGERRQIRNLFESYLTQGILQSANGDYASATRALEQALQSARPLEGQNVVPSSRRSLRDMTAWMTSLSGAESETVHTGSSSPLKAVAVSPDQTMIVAGGENGTLYVFRDGMTAPTEINAHLDLVTDVEFFPDGLVVATVGADRMVRLFAVSAAIGSSGAAPVSEPYREWRAGAIGALAISPDGSQLVTGDDDGDITVWNAGTGAIQKAFSAHQGAVSDVKFSADGRHLISSSFDRTAKVWSTHPAGSYRALFTTPKSEDPLVAAALDPTGAIAATAGTDGVIRLWNVTRKESLQRLVGHQNVITDLLFGSRGDRLVSASLDRTIRTWDVASGVRLQVLQGHDTGVTDLSLRHDTLFSSSNDQTIRRWPLVRDAKNGMTVSLGNRSPRAVAISPQNHRVAVGFVGGDISLYSLPEMKILGTAKFHDADITRIRFSPDGRRLASSSFDGHICYLESHGSGLRLRRGFSNHVDVVNDVAFAPDGKTLASASIGSRLQVNGNEIEESDNRGGEIALLNLESGEVRSFPAHKREVLAVTFNATGDQLLSSGDDGNSIVWHRRGDNLTAARQLRADPDMAYTAQFQPFGEQIATAGRSGTLRVFDRQSSKLMATLPGHENAILRLFYTPDGGHIITAGADGTLRLWDIERSRAAFVLRLPVARGGNENSLWDFAFNYNAGSGGWMAIPLAEGKLILHRLGTLLAAPAANRVGQNAR